MIALHLIALYALVVGISFAREVLELEGNTFELALTAHKYIAVLFYDKSSNGQQLAQTWNDAALLIDDNAFPADCEMAKINGHDPELKELIDAYSIVVPSIKIFRKGILAEYRGPSDSEGMAEYIKEDAMPSVKLIDNVETMKKVIEATSQTSVFGFFPEEDMTDDDTTEGYSIEPWGQFLASADSLRGHASFYAVNSPDIMKSLKLKALDLPSLFMMPSEGEGFLKYSGEILEMSVSEWVLRNSAPPMGELSISSSSGELYATQFFSSRKLKFILFLKPVEVDDEVLAAWKELSELFTGKAIFAYMTQTDVADVVEYFGINVDTDLPLIAAHQPTADNKYKSKKIDVHDKQALQDFVTGVVTGLVPKVLKSEPLPKKNPGPVKRVVGNNVIDVVSTLDTDVLLAVTVPWCAQCKRLLPTFDLLGRAVQGESRILVAKIDGSANDLPAAWGVKNYPALLWFPARDKPYKNHTVSVPRPYWDAGISLQELVGFVQRDSSFDAKTLRVATTEQLGSLLGDEEMLRAKYEEEEKTMRRNEGRVVYEDPTIDWLLGEVVFDGKRWHIGVAGVVIITWIVMTLYIISLQSAQKVVKKKKAQ